MLDADGTFLYFGLVDPYCVMSDCVMGNLGSHDTKFLNSLQRSRLRKFSSIFSSNLHFVSLNVGGGRGCAPSYDVCWALRLRCRLPSSDGSGAVCGHPCGGQALSALRHPVVYGYVVSLLALSRLALQRVACIVTAPEQCYGDDGYGKAVDWWSLGVTIFHLITGSVCRLLPHLTPVSIMVMIDCTCCC